MPKLNENDNLEEIAFTALKAGIPVVLDASAELIADSNASPEAKEAIKKAIVLGVAGTVILGAGGYMVMKSVKKSSLDKCSGEMSSSACDDNSISSAIIRGLFGK